MKGQSNILSYLKEESISIDELEGFSPNFKKALLFFVNEPSTEDNTSNTPADTAPCLDQH